MSANPAARPAESGPEVPARERRGAPRFPVVQKCLVRPDGAPVSTAWHGIAYNVSANGVGVALPSPVPVGSVLVIEPWGLPTARPLRARVVRGTPVSFLWFCGCELTERLSEAELRGWLAGPPQLLGRLQGYAV